MSADILPCENLGEYRQKELYNTLIAQRIVFYNKELYSQNANRNKVRKTHSTFLYTWKCLICCVATITCNYIMNMCIIILTFLSPQLFFIIWLLYLTVLWLFLSINTGYNYPLPGIDWKYKGIQTIISVTIKIISLIQFLQISRAKESLRKWYKSY